jgi:Carboxypeptidase regulatory-like domain
MKYKLLLLSIAFSVTAFIARANNTNPPGAETDGNKKIDIAGGVVHSETKKPLGSVNVIAYSANKKEKAVLTDGNGNYFFNELKPGLYKLIFEKDGFKRVTRDKVMIRAEYGCQLNVEMDENDEFQILPGLLFTDFEK